VRKSPLESGQSFSVAPRSDVEDDFLVRCVSHLYANFFGIFLRLRYGWFNVISVSLSLSTIELLPIPCVG